MRLTAKERQVLLATLVREMKLPADIEIEIVSGDSSDCLILTAAGDAEEYIHPFPFISFENGTCCGICNIGRFDHFGNYSLAAFKLWADLQAVAMLEASTVPTQTKAITFLKAAGFTPAAMGMGFHGNPITLWTLVLHPLKPKPVARKKPAKKAAKRRA